MSVYAPTGQRQQRSTHEEGIDEKGRDHSRQLAIDSISLARGPSKKLYSLFSGSCLDDIVIFLVLCLVWIWGLKMRPGIHHPGGGIVSRETLSRKTLWCADAKWAPPFVYAPGTWQNGEGTFDVIFRSPRSGQPVQNCVRVFGDKARASISRYGMPLFGQNLFSTAGLLNPFRVPKLSPILFRSSFVPKTGFQW